MFHCRQNGHCGSSKTVSVTGAAAFPSVSPCCGMPANVEIASGPPVLDVVSLVVVVDDPEPPAGGDDDHRDDDRAGGDRGGDQQETVPRHGSRMPEPSVGASVEAHKNGGGPVARASAVIRSGVRAQQVGAG